MLEYARWKYVLVVTVFVLALFFALPNFFGEDAALQLARKDHAAIDAAAEQTVQKFLTEQKIGFTKTYIDAGRLMVRFPNVVEQLKARDAVNDHYVAQYLTALSFAPRAPEWLRRLGLRPMPLGLDLRGGLYLLYQVDINGAINQLLEGYEQDVRRTLAQAKLPFTDIVPVSLNSERPNGLRVTLPANADAAAVKAALAKPLSDLKLETVTLPGGPAVQASLTPVQMRQRQDYAIQQNLTTLRNRVNELGVSEPIVQRQGLDRINVQ
ncbi:MAG TPA: hypothetical protein VII70_09845, partial [Steroidobacteraceae bacterium]